VDVRSPDVTKEEEEVVVVVVCIDWRSWSQWRPGRRKQCKKRAHYEKERKKQKKSATLRICYYIIIVVNAANINCRFSIWLA
jgi:heme-degrading monooxygenase HmoA